MQVNRCISVLWRQARLLTLIIIVYTLSAFYLAHIQLDSIVNNHAPVHMLQQKSQQTRPTTLRSIVDIQTGEIIGNPQGLLDFAIIGHGKCGTTSIQHWLMEHDEIYCPDDELLELSMGTHPQFLQRLVKESLNATESQHPKMIQKVLLGYKNPGEIRIPKSIQFLSRWFPKTLLIVGIRHPVLWFESLYNFKVQNLPGYMPSNYWGDPNDLVDKCQDFKEFNCVGTAKGHFHIHLALLGKTNHTQDQLAKEFEVFANFTQKPPTTFNPVFLFDVDQLNDVNSTRMDRFQQDLQVILGLKHPLGPVPRTKPGKVWPKRLQKKRDRAKMRICDDHYQPLRHHLMKIARQASNWIRNSGFLDHPDVHVSSRDHLEHILETRWMKDPCVQEQSGGNDSTN
jgi:hypothetical protein